MTTRTDIMDLTGAPLKIADLTGEEMRALGVLAEAGLIAPVGAVPQRKAAPQKAAPQKAAPQKAAPQKAAPQKPAPQKVAPRTGNSRKAPARSGEVQGTLMAA
jgi:hypothetical protein